MSTTAPGDVKNALTRTILRSIGKARNSGAQLRAAERAALVYFGHRCAYCERQPTEWDHAIAMNRRDLGLDDPGNRLPCCAQCNREKGDRHFRDFLIGRADGQERITRIAGWMNATGYVPLGDEPELGMLIQSAIEQARAGVDGLIETAIATITDARGRAHSPA